MKKFIIFILTTFLVISFGFIILNSRYDLLQSEEKSQQIYAQGLENLKNNDLQNAYYNFSKISNFSSLYEPSLFRQGLIATELNDNNSAIKAYETLLSKFPNTFFAEKSVYNLAVAYFNVNMKENAYANFKLIRKKYSNSNYADASNYFLGMLTKDNDEKKAVEYFIDYINDAPSGRYSAQSINELIKLNKKYNDEQNLSIGIALLKNNKSNEAIDYLNKANFSDAWAYLTIAYINIKDKSTAKKIFEEGISKYSTNNSEIQETAIEEYAKFFRTRSKGLIATKLLCDKSNCKLNDYIMYNLISSVDKGIKLAYYKKIYEEFPDGDYAAEALFNSMFNDYLSGNYDNAIAKGKKHLSKYQNKNSTPATMYWLAKSFDKKRNHLEANSYYNRLYTKYFDSYYAFLAYAKLNRIDNPFVLNNYTKVPTDKINIDLPILHANLPINSSKKIDDLLKVKDFKIFEYADFDNEIIKSWVAYYEGNFTKASVIAEKVLKSSDVKPSFDDDIYKLIYVIDYSDLINKYATKENKISPYLLLSLIKKESRFNPNAVSSTSAQGLMQIMPSTAQYIAKMSDVKYNQNDLFIPNYNILLGTNYYNYLKTNHYSNDVYALASYNAGPGVVGKWLVKYGVPKKDEIDELIEQIPYAETEDYIKQIYKNYWVYNCIYNSFKFK